MRAQLTVVAVLCAAGTYGEAAKDAHQIRLQVACASRMRSQSHAGHDPATRSHIWPASGPGLGGPASTTWDWSWRDLQALPGIGPRRASAIVQARHFDVYAAAVRDPATAARALGGASAQAGVLATAAAGPPGFEALHLWRSFGPELLDLLPGIGPATVAALREHWRSLPASSAQAELAGRRRGGRAVPPVEYTPPPARRP